MTRSQIIIFFKPFTIILIFLTWQRNLLDTQEQDRTQHKRQQLQLNCSCIPWWNWVIQSPCSLNMISLAVPEKQRRPPVVPNLLSLSLASLSLLFQRIFSHFLFLSYHSRHFLEPPSPPRLSPAWAFGLIWNPWDKGLFQPCQSGHNASLSARAPSVCLPHTHPQKYH